MSEFPWTLDQFQRYAVLREFLPILLPDADVKILDVGGLSPDRDGRSFWLPVKSGGTGFRVVLDQAYWKEAGFVQGDGRSLPFKDASFDCVCAFDVLEHVPPEDRERFLGELSRVTKNVVILSAPLRTSETEKSEGLLLTQIEKVYGVVQQQLCEHRQFGLPERDRIAQLLRNSIPVGEDFSFGSLTTWLPYQTLKNCFMMRRDSARIQALLDQWMTDQTGPSEFEPPFSRHFWIATKDIPAERLADGVRILKHRLSVQARHDTTFDDLVSLHEKIVDYQCRKRVSAVLVSSGRTEFLVDPLKHILSQNVDFDLEVCVWTLREDGDFEKYVKRNFPGVVYFSSPENARLPQALREVAARLSGDDILILSEDVFLPPDAVRRLFEALEADLSAGLLTPRILDVRQQSHVLFGKKGFFEKAAIEGWRKYASPKASRNSDWLYSECLLFRRATLLEAEFEPRPVTKRNLFLWQKAEGEVPFKQADEIIVHKKDTRGSFGLNILHGLHQYFPARGGSEWLMQNVSERLAARGHAVRVVATNAHSTEDFFLPGKGMGLMPVGEDEINNVVVRRVPFSRRGHSLLNRLRGLANRMPIPFGDQIRMISWGPRSRSYQREILRATDLDIVAACPLPNMHVWYAWKGARKKGLPFVVIPCYHTEDRWTYHNELYFRMLRDADAVIALTEWEKDYLAAEGRIDPARIHVLGVGIELDDFQPSIDIREKYGIRQKEIVLFLGQHGRHKGILDLLYAMRWAWKERPDVAYVIAGNPTAATAEIEAHIAAMAAEERDRIYLIRGFPEGEKRAFMQAADLFVSVSSFESFGIVYLEAWREKKPVIGCKRGASAKLIDEFRDGLLVHEHNPIELAGAILELLEHRDVRIRMGLAGYAKIRRKYAWDKIIDQWENIYREVVRRKRHSS